MSSTAYILQTASDTINKRASDRDVAQERSMAACVTAFNAVYKKDLLESEGWGFMVLLKQVRGSIGPYKEDDFVDMAAYSALQAEARELEATPAKTQVTTTASVESAPVVSDAPNVVETPASAGEGFSVPAQVTDQQSQVAIPPAPDAYYDPAN